MIKYVKIDGEEHPFLLNIPGMELVMDELDINPFEILQSGHGTPKGLRILIYAGFRGGYLATKKDCPYNYDEFGEKMTLPYISIFSKLITSAMMQEKSNGQPKKKVNQNP